MQPRTVIAIIYFCSLITAAPCFAHKVRIFAWSEGNIIHTESKFSGGKAAQHSTVSVVESSTGKELLHGNTDQHGLFQFPIPETESQEIDIVVSSGDGHKNHWRFQLSPPPADTADNPQTDTATSEIIPELPLPVNLTQQQFTAVMNNLLEAKLAPIRRQLAQQQEQPPSLQDILGGIGYILGLAGIAAYIKSKKK